MGLWASYFFAKCFLYLRGAIPLDAPANLLFAVWLLLPTPARLALFRSVAAIRTAVTVIAALLLLWHDSWLPPLTVAAAFVRDGGLPSTGFILQFLAGAAEPWVVGGLALLVAACALIRRHVRLTPLVFLALGAVLVSERAVPREEMDRYVASFYAEESGRLVDLGVAPDPSGIDVVILHVCSLSWDDLAAVGMAEDPFFDRFDYLFTSFNSVTSHSNPAAIRLLRAGCGQPPHDALYRPAVGECYVLDALRAAGYRTSFALNHDGRYGGFADEVRRLGHADGEMGTSDLPVRQIDFDGSAIRDDAAVLERWWATRQRTGVPRAALYYNTITLHDGGHGVGEDGWWTRDRAARYREAARALFRDVTAFAALMEASGRRGVVVFVPEHGMALRGSAIQPAGLREVPLPQITTVPVGVRLIGPWWRRGERPFLVTEPTSYLALARLLADLLGRPELARGDAGSARIAADLPRTAFLAENQTARVVRRGSDYFVKARSSGAGWTKLAGDAASEPPGAGGGPSSHVTIVTEGHGAQRD